MKVYLSMKASSAAGPTARRSYVTASSVRVVNSANQAVVPHSRRLRKITVSLLSMVSVPWLASHTDPTATPT